MGDLVYLNGNLYHSDDLSDEYLAHYGVKGMKWGRRGLKAKNNKAWDRYTNESNRAALDYDNRVAKIKGLKKAGQIDRKTYKQKKSEALDRLSNKELDLASKYAKTVKKNKAVRKEAVKKNKRAYNNMVFDYKNESGKAYRHLLNKDYLGARASGLTRKQAYLDAYTGRTRKEMIYNR